MTERSCELAREWFEEVWNKRNIDDIARRSRSDVIAHQTAGDSVGYEDFREDYYRRFSDAFPDLQFEVEAVVADGPLAAVRWFATGTHTGDGIGVKASGQHIGIRGTTWFRFEEEKIAEAWDCWDHGGLLQSLWRAAPPGE